jgi:hypothetical protein
VYEEKVDGWRILAYKDGARVRLGSATYGAEGGRRQTGAEETMLDRVMTWRFAVLVGVGLVDAAVFMVPLVPVALLVAVLLAPQWLRRAARFLDALADGR